jgi:hypothetical protein
MELSLDCSPLQPVQKNRVQVSCWLRAVTARFRIKDYMGCILPLKGVDGTVVN